MNSTRALAALTLLASIFVTGTNAAQEPTREQVHTATLRAIVAGEFAHYGSNSETGESHAQQYPHLYPAAPALPGKTRAEVNAATLEAIRLGQIVHGETGEIAADLFPHLYSAN